MEVTSHDIVNFSQFRQYLFLKDDIVDFCFVERMRAGWTSSNT